MNPEAPLISADGASFGYHDRPVVRVERFRLHPGRCVGVYGPNGAGKTTLLRGLAGLIAPMSGTVRTAPVLRIGYLAQHRTLLLHWPMTALDAASMALSSRHVLGWVGHAGRSRVRGAMQRLGVDDLAARPFAELSAGQQQRLLLAGLLADGPQVIVLDEPSDGLDAESRRRLLAQLLDARKTNGVGIVLVSHLVEEIAALCRPDDEVLVLRPPPHAGEAAFAVPMRAADWTPSVAPPPTADAAELASVSSAVEEARR